MCINFGGKGKNFVFRSDRIYLVALIYGYFVRGWFEIELLYFYWLEPFLLMAVDRLFFYSDLKNTFIKSLLYSKNFAMFRMETFSALLEH
jgi:hypothetical protein